MSVEYLTDGEGFMDLMTEFWQFGQTDDGGMHRLTCSRVDGHARDHLIKIFERLGMTTRVDSIGNIFGILELAGPDAPNIMIGSHLDSQPCGGRYDGAYGVIAGCEVARAIKSRAKNEGFKAKYNLVVANWTNEEGARFQPSLLGSSVYAGLIELSDALACKDGDGVSVAEALDEIGYRGADDAPKADAYLELHVECATKLEKLGAPVGVVTHHWGATKYRVALLGRTSHTGSTPMEEREDALLAAAKVIVDIRSFADKYPGKLHTSVGRCVVKPNSPNMVPDEAELFVELRSGDEKILDTAEEMLNESLRSACETPTTLSFDVRSIDKRAVGYYDERLRVMVIEAAKELGIDAVVKDTVGGDDAVALAHVCPSLLIHVPSRNGICHHPSEFTDPEDLKVGVEVFGRTLLNLIGSEYPNDVG